MPYARFSLAFIVAAGVMLGGCFDRSTAFVLFPHSQFVTVADVDLRSGQHDDSSVIARLPKGTVVTPIGQMGSECSSCWRVDSPQGVGWLYTYYLASLPPAD
jgi:hypothetical protein